MFYGVVGGKNYFRVEWTIFILYHAVVLLGIAILFFRFFDACFDYILFCFFEAGFHDLRHCLDSIPCLG